LPGGRVEPGEDLHAALRREVAEETGCALDSVDRLSGIYLEPDAATLLVVFRATSRTTSPVAHDDDDALEAGWFDPAEAIVRVTHVSEHQRLVDALADGAEVVYRVYRGGGGG
jgi:8-oxo-dGTP pyrophosphatase MutT (NUDIX family)